MQKTILITGSTDGIGLATAGMLVEQGHRVGTRSAHDMLLTQGGLYARLYETQFRHASYAEDEPNTVGNF